MTRALARQAVVVVHGIGEQIPAATVRSFVLGDESADLDDDAADGVAGERRDGRRIHTVTSAPDDITGRSYSRKFRVTWNHPAPTAPPPNPAAGGDADGGEAEEGELAREEVEAGTDFFELYWAPRYRDTTPGDLLGWATRLLRRDERTIRTSRLAGPRRSTARVVARLLGWIAVVVAGAGLAKAAVDHWAGTEGWAFFPDETHGVLTLGWTLTLLIAGFLVGLAALGVSLRVAPISAARHGVVPLVVAGAAAFGAAAFRGLTLDATVIGILSFVSAAVATAAALNFGDVPRYTVVSPRNVEETERLRVDAVDMIRKLHEQRSRNGGYLYERIVVVGHSLGSIVAYDALRLHWAEIAPGLEVPRDPTTPMAIRRLQAATDVEAAGRAVTDAATDLVNEDWAQVESRDASAAGLFAGNGPLMDATAGFRQAQRRLSETLRYPLPDDETVDLQPRRWAVTDFITLGSPLAHCEVLLADSFDDHLRQLADRVHPTCPPQPQVGEELGGTYRFWEGPDSSRFHSGALFAATVWTNVYFTRDGIGGPVSPALGPAIDDHAVGAHDLRGLIDYASRTHSAYWRRAKIADQVIGTRASLRVLRELIVRPPRLVVEATDRADAEAIARAIGACTPAASGTGTTSAVADEDRLEVSVQFPAERDVTSGERVVRAVVGREVAGNRADVLDAAVVAAAGPVQVKTS